MIYLKFACLIVGAFLALTRALAVGLVVARRDYENTGNGILVTSEVFGILFFILAMVFICLSMK